MISCTVDFRRGGIGSIRDPSPSRTTSLDRTFGRERSGGLLVPLHMKSTQMGSALEDKNKWNRPFSTPEPKIGTRGGQSAYEDSQRTTIGHNSFAVDSQMTFAEQPSSYGSQNCSYNDSQSSLPTEEVISSQHRLPSHHSTSGVVLRGCDKFDPSGNSRAQTPVSSVGSRNILQDHRPPKAPTWNSTLIKRAASPV